MESFSKFFHLVPLIIAVNAYNENRQFHSQRYGQQQQLAQDSLQQYHQQRNQRYELYQQQRNIQGTNAANPYFATASYSGAKFISTPVSNLNGTAGALLNVQLLQYSDPGFALPDGNTCACPQGQTCPYLQVGIASCFFSFTVIISAPNQSVQYIASPFVPVSNNPISVGEWTTAHLLNMTVKPMAIDIFVHHLGVVISQETGNLINFDHLVLVDTFVVSLFDYQATPYGTAPNTIQTVVTGRLLGTNLKLAYSVQCIGGKQGPNCDLKCAPSPFNSKYAACVSIITGMYSSCLYIGNVVSSCSPCPYGLVPEQTACDTPRSATVTHVGVSSAFRVWTIVLGCLLGFATLFIILLVVVFIVAQNRYKKTIPHSRYVENAYRTQPTTSLLHRDNEEWRRGRTKATTGGSGFTSRTPTFDQEVTQNEFARGNEASTSRREAHV